MIEFSEENFLKNGSSSLKKSRESHLRRLWPDPSFFPEEIASLLSWWDSDSNNLENGSHFVWYANNEADHYLVLDCKIIEAHCGFHDIKSCAVKVLNFYYLFAFCLIIIVHNIFSNNTNHNLFIYPVYKTVICIFAKFILILMSK